MKNYRSNRSWKKTGWYGLLFLLTLILTAGGLHAATDRDPLRYHQSGELTAVEDTQFVIIDQTGYAVDPAVLVVNLAGQPVALDQLTLPVVVNFDYIYAETAPKTMSPVVVYIEESTKSEASEGSQK